MISIWKNKIPNYLMTIKIQILRQQEIFYDLGKITSIFTSIFTWVTFNSYDAIKLLLLSKGIK